jgi:hypothetical protein
VALHPSKAGTQNIFEDDRMSHQPQLHGLKLGAAKPVLGIRSELRRRRRQSMQIGFGVDHGDGEPAIA